MPYKYAIKATERNISAYVVHRCKPCYAVFCNVDIMENMQGCIVSRKNGAEKHLALKIGYSPVRKCMGETLK